MPDFIFLYAQSEQPHATAGPGLTAYVAGLVITLAVGIWLVVHLGRHLDEPGEDDADGEGGGGGGPRKPSGPRPRPEPEWWPEFERQFADYVKSRLTRSR